MKIIKLIIVLIILYAVIGITTWGTGTKWATPDAIGMEPPTTFEVVSFHLEWSGYNNNTLFAVGEVKNTGNIAAGVALEVIVRDKGGVLVDTTGTFWPNSIYNIKPGSSCGIKTHITEDRRAVSGEIRIVRINTW